MSELWKETVSDYTNVNGGIKMITGNICSKLGENNTQFKGLVPR